MAGFGTSTDFIRGNVSSLPTRTLIFNKWLDPTNRYTTSGTGYVGVTVPPNSGFPGASPTSMFYGMARQIDATYSSSPSTGINLIVGLAISSSVLHENLVAVPNPLAHWSPNIEDNASEFYADHYLLPAIAWIEAEIAAGNLADLPIVLEAFFVSVNSDGIESNGAAFISNESLAANYALNLSQVIDYMEGALDVYGTPLVICEIPNASISDPDGSGFSVGVPHREIIRQQQEFLATRRASSVLAPTGHLTLSNTDEVHPTTMSVLETGARAILARQLIPTGGSIL